MNRIFVVRVGADTGYPRLKSPIFSDRRFELMPIWEEDEGRGHKHPIEHKPPMLHYCDIPCFNNPRDNLPRDNLAKYLVESDQEMSRKAAHNDPEFKTMTYGDLYENPRASNLKGVELGDYLFFLARLERYNGQTFLAGDWDNYFIGYFHVESITKPMENPLELFQKTNIANNAHVLRAKADPANKDYKFWVFGGGQDSHRFNHALEASYDWISTVFKDRHNCDWHEHPQQNKKGRVMSYLRTIRCQIDPSKPGQQDSYKRFFDKIHQHLSRDNT